MPVTKLTDDCLIAVSADQISCDLAGEAAILNLKNSVYYGLDSVGSSVWSLIQQPRTVGEIKNTLLSEYEVESAQLETDLHTLLTQLSEQGLIEIQL